MRQGDMWTRNPLRYRATAALLNAMLAMTIAWSAGVSATDADQGPLDLDAELATLIGLHPGGAVALAMRDGEIITGVTGFADAGGTPMTVDSGFRVGAFSLPFIAIVILQLVEEGTLDLDERLSTYLPDVPIGGDATIRELLTQEARLPGFTGEVLARHTNDPTHMWSVEEMIDIAAEVAQNEGSATTHGVTEHVLLVRLVDVLEGGFGDSLDRRIAKPLGLEGTAMPATRLTDAPMAAGWLPQLGLEGQHDIGGIDTFSGARTTAGDIATFLNALHAGELVSDELVTEVFAESDGPLTLGGFFPPGRLRYPDTPYVGTADGDIAGYSIELLVDPGSGDLAVVLVNDARMDPLPVIDAILASWGVEIGERPS